jgi:ABC-type multidrug transport system fused ATPase/permease subunit
MQAIAPLLSGLRPGAAHAIEASEREAGLSNGGNIVQFDNVGLRYGTGAETLSDLSFSLRHGGFYFLTGPSGAGKTSLLKLLYLAQRPSRGLIKLFGEDIVTMPRKRLPASAGGSASSSRISAWSPSLRLRQCRAAAARRRSRGARI